MSEKLLMWWLGANAAVMFFTLGLGSFASLIAFCYVAIDHQYEWWPAALFGLQHWLALAIGFAIDAPQRH